MDAASGEAWNHPFVCVYEPSSDTEPGDIASVDYFTPSEWNRAAHRLLREWKS